MRKGYLSLRKLHVFNNVSLQLVAHTEIIIILRLHVFIVSLVLFWMIAQFIPPEIYKAMEMYARHPS